MLCLFSLLLSLPQLSHGTTTDLFHPDKIFPSHFLDNFFERQSLHVNGSAHDLVAALETTSTDIHDIIKQMDVDTASAHVKLASSNVPKYCSVDGRQCLAQAGAQDTIIVDGFEYLSPTFFQFVRSWKTQLGVFIGANMYLTPTLGQGLRWHSDKSDVVAIQLEGIKQWSVCQRVLPNLNRDDLGELPPFTDLEVRESKHLASVVKTCKVIELHPGDVLYMPAGVVHRAHAVERSLHVTLSISRTHHGASLHFIFVLLFFFLNDKTDDKITFFFLQNIHGQAFLPMELQTKIFLALPHGCTALLRIMRLLLVCLAFSLALRKSPKNQWESGTFCDMRQT